MIAPLQRADANPVLVPEDVPFAKCTGVFNAGAVADSRTGRVVLLFRAFEADTGRSSIGLAVSNDGIHFDDVRDRPALARVEPYEEWGTEDPRVTWLAAEGRYAITYTGHSPAGPRLCLATTDDILDPSRYVRHGPRLATENKNGVVFPETVGGRYAVLHRPMPRIVLARVAALTDPWPAAGAVLLGPEPGTWRSSRVGAGAPPLRTRLGWLLAFHGATTVPEGNVYSMGWCVLDGGDPARVRYVSREPALAPETDYEIHHAPLPQVDMANFPGGIRVVFPCGLVERGPDLIVYYGAADRVVAAARVEKEALLESLEAAIARGGGDAA
jgi:beta-1,2-mannobiose phosphorylase / 1,2-beta-oligomannan phosphorylase